jgi:enoyl-[acyl-carrier-protein] reductase (NADH)
MAADGSAGQVMPVHRGIGGMTGMPIVAEPGACHRWSYLDQTDYLGGLQVAFHAMEALRRQLSMELGQYGIRVVTLRTGGIPESITSDFEGRDAIVEDIAKSTMLNRAATLEDVGNVAAFVASDRARSMTAATANVSCGALID